MKSQLLVSARRPVPSGRVANFAIRLPTRACIANGCRHRLPVRGSALPGRHTRHCSPPTAMADENVTNSTLVAWPSVRRGTVGSYGGESDIQTLAMGVLLAHDGSRLGAIASDQTDVGAVGLIATTVDREPNRQAPFTASLPDRTQRLAGELAGAAALCCQGSARDRQCGSHSPPPLTAAAFRLFLLLGSGFGNTKAGALFSQLEHDRRKMRRPAVAAIALAHSLDSTRLVVGSSARLSAPSDSTDQPGWFPFKG